MRITLTFPMQKKKFKIKLQNNRQLTNYHKKGGR